MRSPARSTVLIVEGNPTVSDLLVDLLQDEGYLTLAVGNGGGALDLLATVRPDVIVLSLNLAGLSGERLLAHLRSQTATCDLPVVLIAGLVQLPAGLADKSTAIVRTPFAINHLLAAIERATGANLRSEREVGE